MANEFQLAEAYTEFTHRDAGFNSGLKSAEASMERTAARMRKLGFAAKLMFVAMAAGAVLFVKEAAEVEEIVGKFDAVFKEQAAATRVWAESFANDVGRSRFAMQEFLATLQDTFVPLGFARERAAEMSKELVTLGIDLASFNNAAEPETINLLTSALVGNHEAVRRFGIIITEATLKQELLTRGIKGGTKAASEQEKVMARMAIIMRSTSDAQGDAKRTAGSLTNQVRALEGAWRDVKVEVGNALIPTVKNLVTWLKTKKEVITRTLLVLVEFVKRWGGLIVQLGVAVIAIKAIRIALDLYRARLILTAKAQALFHALAGPTGWIKLAAALVVAAVAIEGVRAAYGSMEEAANKAMRAAQGANAAAAAAPSGDDAGSSTTADRAAERRAAAVGRTADDVFARGMKDVKEGFVRSATEHSHTLGRLFQAAPLGSKEEALLGKQIEDLALAIRAAEQEARARGKEEAKARRKPERRRPRAVGAPSFTTGMVGIEQSGAMFQSAIAQNEKDQVRYAKEAATTLAAIQNQGIPITNIDEFNARWN